jgi:hypothetical protein
MVQAENGRRIYMWCGPRNVSTALMYSFAERPDTRVVDEPLYAHYLRVSGAQHPGRDEVLAAMETDGAKVMQTLATERIDRPVLFAKQMAHHLLDVDLAWLEAADNILLIRDPREMLPSLAEVLDEVTLRDTAMDRQVELVRHLEERGRRPFCIDARQLLLDPRGVLTQVCQRLDLEFSPSMLAWQPGPRPEDGVWAKYWYASVHRSTGFNPWRETRREMPAELTALHEECRSLYEFLYERAIRAPGAKDHV